MAAEAQKNRTAGFTLVELLISVLIIVAIVGVVLANFSLLDSTTLLRSLAFEIATSVREAQVISLSARGDASGSDFDVPYGVSFSASDPKHYSLFQNDYTTPFNTYTIGRTMQIADICITKSPTTYCHTDDTDEITRLDISFLRPEFTANYTVQDLPSGVANDEIDTIEIKINSAVNVGNVWIVEVGRLGNIAVFKE